MNNNIGGVYKRGVSIGAIVTWGNLNGIMSSNVYRDRDKPWYRLGHSIILGYVAICLVGGSVVNLIFLSLGNRRRKIDEATGKENGNLDEDFMETRSDFRYLL
jgi:hypothetical protein